MSCSSATTNQPADAIDIPVITLNGTVIPPEGIAREAQYHAAESPEQALYKASEALIIRHLLLDKAKQAGLDQSVAAEESELPEEAMIRLLLEREAVAEPPTDDDCRRYFEANRGKFSSPDLLEVSHILLAAPQNDQKQKEVVRQEAIALIQKLQSTPDKFAGLAKQYSACPSKETGGNLGQLTKGQTVPEFEREVFAMEAGLAATPVESRYGFHVVNVNQKITGRPLEYDHVQEKIFDYLCEVRQRVAISQYIHHLIDEADIEGIDLNQPLVQ